MKKIKVNIITSYRPGGPYYQGAQLAERLNSLNDFEAVHTKEIIRLLLTPFYQTADIVHATVPIAFHLWSQPLILTVKGNYPIEKNIWRSFYPAAIKKADIVTVPSQYLKKELNLINALVIPNAVDLDKFEPAELSSVSKLNLVTVTKFYFSDKAEGVLKIIELLDRLPKSVKEKITYYIIGGGPFLDETKEKASKFSVNFKFTGMSSPQQFLSNADIFLYYSTHDNMPNAVLEGMASNLPVITNRVGALEEMVEDRHGGFICDTLDEYFSSLQLLLSDHNLRKEMGRFNRSCIEMKFNWKTIINTYTSIYKSCLNL